MYCIITNSDIFYEDIEDFLLKIVFIFLKELDAVGLFEGFFDFKGLNEFGDCYDVHSRVFSDETHKVGKVHH